MKPVESSCRRYRNHPLRVLLRREGAEMRLRATGRPWMAEQQRRSRVSVPLVNLAPARPPYLALGNKLLPVRGRLREAPQEAPQSLQTGSVLGAPPTRSQSRALVPSPASRKRVHTPRVATAAGARLEDLGRRDRAPSNWRRPRGLHALAGGGGWARGAEPGGSRAPLPSCAPGRPLESALGSRPQVARPTRGWRSEGSCLGTACRFRELGTGQGSSRDGRFPPPRGANFPTSPAAFGVGVGGRGSCWCWHLWGGCWVLLVINFIDRFFPILQKVPYGELLVGVYVWRREFQWDKLSRGVRGAVHQRLFLLFRKFSSYLPLGKDSENWK